MSLTLTPTPDDAGPLVAAPQQSSLAAALARVAADPNIDPQRMRELHAIHRDIVADEARVQFSQALVAAQAEMPRVRKDGTVDLGTGKGGYPFAKWEDIDTVVRPIMRQHGFSVTFSEVSRDASGIRWSATYRHVGGHQDQNFITLPPDTGPGRNALQASGSTASYAKRYLVEGFFNIVREGVDDDGKRGGTVFLSEDQVAELVALMKETQTNEGRFLDAMRPGSARSLEEVESEHYPRLKNALLTKRAKLDRERAP